MRALPQHAQIRDSFLSADPQGNLVMTLASCISCLLASLSGLSTSYKRDTLPKTMMTTLPCSLQMRARLNAHVRREEGTSRSMSKNRKAACARSVPVQAMPMLLLATGAMLSDSQSPALPDNGRSGVPRLAWNHCNSCRQLCKARHIGNVLN